MSKLIDLIGKRFNKLIVIKYLGKSKWLCLCDCGNKTIVSSGNLKSNHVKSCGCLNKEIARKKLTTHNLSNTRIYKIFMGMKKRCYNQKAINYCQYGQRGITICQEWLNNFELFYNWSLNNGYKDNLTIDRIDVNGNYEPNNCRWVTQAEQNLNTRRNHYLTFNGKTHTMKEWTKLLNLTYSALQHRIKRGWTMEKIINTPLKTTDNLK